MALPQRATTPLPTMAQPQYEKSARRLRAHAAQKLAENPALSPFERLPPSAFRLHAQRRKPAIYTAPTTNAARRRALFQSQRLRRIRVEQLFPRLQHRVLAPKRPPNRRRTPTLPRASVPQTTPLRYRTRAGFTAVGAYSCDLLRADAHPPAAKRRPIKSCKKRHSRYSPLRLMRWAVSLVR